MKMSAVSVSFDNLVFHPTQRVPWLFLLLFLAGQWIWPFWSLPFLLPRLFGLWLTKRLLLQHLDGLGLVRGEGPGVPLLLHLPLRQL